MSLDATVWAWKKQFTQVKGGPSPALKKLVLLSMADRADEQHCCYPSTTRLAEDCQINKKTLFKILDELILDGVIFDTGERKGRTKQVIVYRLIGVQPPRKTRSYSASTYPRFDIDNYPKLLIDSLKGTELLFKDDNIFVKEKIEFAEPTEDGCVWLSCVFINETNWLDKKVNFDWLAGRVA